MGYFPGSQYFGRTSLVEASTLNGLGENFGFQGKSGTLDSSNP